MAKVAELAHNRHTKSQLSWPPRLAFGDYTTESERLALLRFWFLKAAAKSCPNFLPSLHRLVPAYAAWLEAVGRKPNPCRNVVPNLRSDGLGTLKPAVLGWAESWHLSDAGYPYDWVVPIVAFSMNMWALGYPQNRLYQFTAFGVSLPKNMVTVSVETRYDPWEDNEVEVLYGIVAEAKRQIAEIRKLAEAHTQRSQLQRGEHLVWLARHDIGQEPVAVIADGASAMAEHIRNQISRLRKQIGLKARTGRPRRNEAGTPTT